MRLMQVEKPEIFFATGPITGYPYHGWLHNFQGLVPIGMHYSMFSFVINA